MHISEHFLEYTQPTLIVVADRAHATFYLAHKRELTRIKGFKNDRLTIDDPERYTGGVAPDRFAKTTDEKLDDREAHHFYQRIADEMFELYKKKTYREMIICVPEHDRNLLADELHEYVKRTVAHSIPHQLTKMSDNDILATCDAARKHQ